MLVLVLVSGEDRRGDWIVDRLLACHRDWKMWKITWLTSMTGMPDLSVRLRVFLGLSMQVPFQTLKVSKEITTWP